MHAKHSINANKIHTYHRPLAPPFAQHLHNDVDVVDGDAIESLQHGLYRLSLS